MTAKQQMALETDGILRDMRTECASGDDLISLKKSQKLFRNITAVSDSNTDKIEKIVAGIYFSICIFYVYHMPLHALNASEHPEIYGDIVTNFTYGAIFDT